jgi:hypothetical protein
LLQLPFLIATEDTFNEFEVEDNPAGQFSTQRKSWGRAYQELPAVWQATLQALMPFV